jgi:hypothetical protein
MALSFPNPSRNYDESVHGVRFWGDANAKADEVGFLETFDVNLNGIRNLAGKIYSRRRKASYIFAFTMSASDV